MFTSARNRLLAFAGLAVAAVAATASPVLAQTTPTMPAITFPIDTTSIVTALVAAGVGIMILWVGPSVAFGFVKKLISRLRKSVA